MRRLSRRQFVCLMAGAAGTAGALWRGGQLATSTTGDSGEVSRGLTLARRTSWALGADVSLTVLGPTTQQAESALDAAFQELERIEELLSLYRPSSQLCQLNQHGILRAPHPYFVAVLRTARALSERTDGAFDVTVQPLWKLYAAAKEAGRLPSDAEIDEARKKIDWRALTIEEGQIRLGQSGMAVTFNGVAQGFAADRVAIVLREHGIAHALIDTGELNAMGAKPDGNRWQVGIQHPRAEDAFLSLASLAGRCLATSGDYATPFSADYRHHHLFDPRTGRSPLELASVSIAAATALEADALSTAVFVLGQERGLQLVQDTPGADALLVLKNGRIRGTAGFPSGA